MKKTVIITGASSGFGEAIAKHLLELGFKVALGARRIEKLEKIQQELGNTSDVFIHPLDVQNSASVSNFVKACVEKFGHIDHLVNNAGLALGLDTIEESKEEDWKTIWETNVMGVVRVTKSLLPHLKEGSRIINIGSVSSHETYEGGGAYCSSKYAIRAVTQTLRYELMEKGIGVTAVDPGAAETEFSNVRFGGDGQRAKKVYEGFKPLVARDIAEVVGFVLTRPAHVNIDQLVVYATAQTFGKRIVRKIL